VFSQSHYGQIDLVQEDDFDWVTLVNHIWHWFVIHSNGMCYLGIITGLVRDGLMALILTMIFETKDVGLVLFGTTTGFAMILMGIGNLAAPSLMPFLYIYFT